jgi:hypothetical protein
MPNTDGAFSGANSGRPVVADGRVFLGEKFHATPATQIYFFVNFTAFEIIET